ncbi:TetR/AcrR family transcriptional regulator [Rhodococcus sp. NM-2]|uniref:TetR/AcrR family transcriptional regulator n=1 Tax=Rhodococcus sp. NM-2 TaxID=3401174 RepID=UPI003AABC666
MRSPSDDRTARARIRDEALTLFAAHGPDAVTVRDIAAAAGVSPALVLRHYGSKDGLREAVDEHVARTFEAMLEQVSNPAETGPFDAAALPAMTHAVIDLLPADSAIPGYLGRMLLTGGPKGSGLFGRLHAASRDTLARMADAGHADPGADPDVRAAFLLANDLAVLLLRPRLQEILGVDPLSSAGMRRWGAEALSIYRNGLGGNATRI